MKAVTIRHELITEKREYSLVELLMDGRLSEGEIIPPDGYEEETGGLNRRLKAEKQYEWLLRLASRYPVYGEPGDAGTSCAEDEKEAFRTDCYVVSRYAKELREAGHFNDVIAALIDTAEASGDKEGYLSLMEEMTGKGPIFQWISRATEPVLLYYGPTWCYNALNVFIDGLKEGLAKNGIPTLTYDEQTEGAGGLTRFFGQEFQAIFDIQSWLFPFYLKERGMFLHDNLKGPKFDLILDHPVWMKENLEKLPSRTFCLTHDTHYLEFINTYYPAVEKTFLFPPAGKSAAPEEEILNGNRPIGLLFIGTFGDYRKKLEEIHASRPEVKNLALLYLYCLKKNTHLTAEEAFRETLENLRFPFTEEDFLDLFYDYRPVLQLIMYYFREKTVRILLEAGISVEVYGETWKNAPFFDHPCLKFHGDASYEESLELYRKAKISLNIMAWHKGGFTERMANSMANGAVVLTDQTDHPGLMDGRELCMFSLDEIIKLPQKVRELLADEERLKGIRERGYRYALTNHNWRKRGEELLSIIDKEDGTWGQESM